MTMNRRAMPEMIGFTEVFRALWGYDPFPWQEMLAERVTKGVWPRALDLPTAAGKTACLDIAVYALAAQADRPLGERTAPRRVWFVVDRRIVVDEAFERARAIAEKLAAARSGPLKEVADRLRELSGTERPLAVARLRGGILRDDGWARIPSQPAIITSTVDQLGSRLLFRGYGHSLLAAPIFAGLAANDSLIVLDEAHCAVPFLQTLQAIARYRGEGWAEEPLPTPFAFVIMSATPPAEIPVQDAFPGRQRDQALDHPVLLRRLRTSKPAELVAIARARGQGGGTGPADPLPAEAAARAVGYVKEGRRRVAVMVNRVRTAHEVVAELHSRLGEVADVVLLTGRIRPLERDELLSRWTPYLRANGPEEPPRPIVVVSTQCLEVGADFSFDALVTECASLDALRQRFGRLARLGADAPAPAVILVRQEDAEGSEPDPIYGTALANTWRWLEDSASSIDGRLVVDFAFEALQERLPLGEDLQALLAPAEDAPMLLPAHLDLLCQTAPVPHPEPDVSLYLHGRPGLPEVSLVWRCDLAPSPPAEAGRTWLETVALCPPVSAEMLPMPLWVVRAWLSDISAVGDAGDVEGTGVEPAAERDRIRPCLLWRGRDRSRVTTAAGEIAPGDVVVVPAAYGMIGLGQAGGDRAVGRDRLDLWEAARRHGGQPPAVRLTRSTLAPWLDCPPMQELLACAEAPEPDRQALEDAIQAVLDYQAASEDEPPGPPEWWRELLAAAGGGRLETHPVGGVIFFARAAEGREVAEPDLFADDEDLTSAGDREVSFEEHTVSVQRAAAKLTTRCLPSSFGALLEIAARWHDAGKLDERFQIMLRHGDETAAAVGEPLAKSVLIPTSPARRLTTRAASGLPQNFRHELLSEQLARRWVDLPQDGGMAELILHLIASHHGHARPLAPVCQDPTPPAVMGRLGATVIKFPAAERAEAPPSHRFDAGLAERFWRLTRRYGWWGLAYLEAVLRLADWYGSRFVMNEERGGGVDDDAALVGPYRA